MRWGLFAVTVTHTQKHETTLDLTISGEVVHTTDEHPFLLVEGNETRWINASDLTVGATVRDAAGEVGVVEALVVVDAPQVMYNLTVELVATYVVGSGQWVVHNQQCKFQSSGSFGTEDVVQKGFHLDVISKQGKGEISIHPSVVTPDEVYEIQTQILIEPVKLNKKLIRNLERLLTQNPNKVVESAKAMLEMVTDPKVIARYNDRENIRRRQREAELLIEIFDRMSLPELRFLR